jgi:hypothetical protein
LPFPPDAFSAIAGVAHLPEKIIDRIANSHRDFIARLVAPEKR